MLMNVQFLGSFYIHFLTESYQDLLVDFFANMSVADNSKLLYICLKNKSQKLHKKPEM